MRIGKASEDGIPIEDIADKYGDSVGNDQGEDENRLLIW